MIDTLICAAISASAPIPEMQFPVTDKQLTVAFHLFEDTLDVNAALDDLNEVFVPYGFTFSLDTVTMTDIDTTWYASYYNDSIGLPPYGYSIFTGMSEPVRREGAMNVFIFPYLANNIAGFSWIPPYMNGTERHPADGVWMRNDCMDLGTWKHEVGHFMGLYHVFQNVSFCGQDADLHDFQGDNYGDMVRDTPPTKMSFSCESCPASFPETRPWHGYTHTNFMDYHPCRHNFTEGQVARMHAYMSVYRQMEFTGLSQGDVNGDGVIGTLDVLKVLECLGPVVSGCEGADLDTSGIVTVFDLLVVLSNYPG